MAILDFVQTEIDPIDPPSPKKPYHRIKYEVDRATRSKDITMMAEVSRSRDDELGQISQIELDKISVLSWSIAVHCQFFDCMHISRRYTL